VLAGRCSPLPPLAKHNARRRDPRGGAALSPMDACSISLLLMLLVLAA